MCLDCWNSWSLALLFSSSLLILASIFNFTISILLLPRSPPASLPSLLLFRPLLDLSRAADRPRLRDRVWLLERGFVGEELRIDPLFLNSDSVEGLRCSVNNSLSASPPLLLLLLLLFLLLLSSKTSAFPTCVVSSLLETLSSPLSFNSAKAFSMFSISSSFSSSSSPSDSRLSKISSSSFLAASSSFCLSFHSP